METVLSIQAADKRYGEVYALRGASLALARGERLGLLGPNGAGKTTLIRAVAGRVRLDGGEVTLLGAPLRGDSTDLPLRRRLGVVPQEIALYPTLTARENLEVFGALAGVPGPELAERSTWALDWTGLADRAGQQVRGFSGGMKRRLNIACGVLHRPEVVLLDEPTVGVDPQSRERILDMLERLRSQGASLLVTTHQLDEAERMCDRIVILDHGRVIADGVLEELIDRTVGRDRLVVLRLDRQPAAGELPGGEAAGDGASVLFRVQELAAELPQLLERVASAGHRVLDLRIESPSLHAVFLHLTGRELRE